MPRIPALTGLIAGTVFALTAIAAEPTRFTVDDLARVSNVTELDLSPDGSYVVYSASEPNFEEDEAQYDLWRARWDGSEKRALTRTPDSDEYQAAYSPDGKWIAFLSDRGDDDAKIQVWLMPADGGEAEVLTEFRGGVSDFQWAPDSARLAIVADDPELAEGEEEPKQPKPIVIDRHYFKEDYVGWLTDKREHLYLFEIAGKKSTQLTKGANDEQLPAWSPDGTRIAYVTKRGPDPDRNLNWDVYVIDAREGAEEKQVTRFAGADNDPSLDSRPAWSPDGKRIAYLQQNEDKWIYYAPWSLAVVDVASGEVKRPLGADGFHTKPRFTPDGAAVLALVEESRVTHVSRIELATGTVKPLTSGPRFDLAFDVAADGRIAVLGSDSMHPYRIEAVQEGEVPRLIADNNEWLKDRKLAPVEEISFKSEDGTPIDGFLVKPLDYVEGRRYPAILRIHGGPVYQFSHEFMDDWQVFAANGYAVIAANPRGSSGRGFDFAKAIYADWGVKDTADVLAAVDHVVEMGVADPDRLGLGGHSYGGILTDQVIARDERFKGAVSSAGVANIFGSWGVDMYIREYEQELGLPWRDREKFERVSYPFFNADRITTATLFLCNELDDNVPCIGSMQMYQALKSQGVPTRLVIYPNEYHGLTVPSYLKDRMQRMLDWYGLYLGVVPRP
ncbi:MAG TPA: S9 family peptidase [Steroidobacteraceae bacterium]|nr:S9 family peptidase [Steroidobacteraceae bacterium]